ncbi:hypothetical protein [Paenibacillus sp. 32O-W]|uniref:hypothetical protein n=1 Tax=Paenibacillus sp. 32O-W TaxID=1695218 RepID=UPI0011A5C317|nr:hypothetical protein [Paenibacillus sp. 32O-W]
MRRVCYKIAILAILLVALVIPGQALAEYTTPPSGIVTPFTQFDPDFDYLEKGTSYISYGGKGMASIWGETIATRRVDKVGIRLVLQRWTGSEWIDVYTGPESEMSDSSRNNQTIDNLSVLSGYYYRVKSTHWITYGSTKEDGVRYSSTLLIPD